MNRPLMKLSLVAAGAALLLAGCTKKPSRPDPSVTAIGLTPGGSDINTAPTSAPFDPNAAALPLRGEGWEGNQNRSILQAQTVYFQYNSSDIRASEREKLKFAKEYLEKNPGQKLLLEGHCDWRGTAEYNLSLGDRRAAAVKKYLQSLGVGADKVETLSKGSLEASKNADEKTMEKDRRVDLVIVDSASGAARTTAL